MRYPGFLPENGTIGFIAPSFGCNIEPYQSAFKNALNQFQANGYRTKLGPNCFEGSGIGISNTPQKCAQEFMDAWQDPESDILMSCGGGELMCEILPHIDFEKIKNTPAKWFQGYSDNTNLAFLLATICDTAAIYGPCAPAFGMEPWHPSLTDSLSILTGDPLSILTGDPDRKDTSGIRQAFGHRAPSASDIRQTSGHRVPSASDIRQTSGHRAPSASDIRQTSGHRASSASGGMADKNEACSFAVSGYDLYEKESLKDEDHPLVPYNVTEPVVRKRFPDEDTQFSGRLIGGCLDILCMLCGTKYDQVKAFNKRYADDGIIWFLEACDLNVMSIRRAVWQLDQAGWFSHVKGFLIGRPLNGDALFGLDQYDAVTKILSKYNVPILMDLDIGHLPPMMPLIEGSMADVAIIGNDISVQMKLY